MAQNAAKNARINALEVEVDDTQMVLQQTEQAQQRILALITAVGVEVIGQPSAGGVRRARAADGGVAFRTIRPALIGPPSPARHTVSTPPVRTRSARAR